VGFVGLDINLQSSWTVWITVQLKSKLVNLVLTVLKYSSCPTIFNLNLQYLYENCILNRVQNILGDQTYFLYSQYELLPSGRRYRVPMYKLNRYKNSFVPVSVQMLNYPDNFQF